MRGTFEESRISQVVDKTNGGREFVKSFGQAFSKACAVKGAEPLSPVATGEISYTAFLFASFFFAPTACKEKAAKDFVQLNKLYAFGLQPAPVRLDGRFPSSPFVSPCEF